MNQLSLAFKALPTALTVLDAGSKFLNAFQRRKKAADAKDLETVQVEDKVIDVQRSRLLSLGYGFLPEKFREKATIQEANVFLDAVKNLALAIESAIEAFVPLTKA